MIGRAWRLAGVRDAVNRWMLGLREAFDAVLSKVNSGKACEWREEERNESSDLVAVTSWTRVGKRTRA